VKTKDFSPIRNCGDLPAPEGIQIPDDLGDLLDEYIDSTTSMLDDLEQAAMAYERNENTQENAATIRRILHKIKGESSMTGIDDIAELCHQAEFAFEELPEQVRPDMLLQLKDWICAAMQNLKA
jgi:chemotaxis protein histidine kinase CheA